MIGLGTELRTAGDFNRRAARALSGVSFRPGSRQLALAQASIAAINAGVELDPKQQQKLYNLVHHYRRHISDHLVKEFAAMRAKEAD